MPGSRQLEPASAAGGTPAASRLAANLGREAVAVALADFKRTLARGEDEREQLRALGRGFARLATSGVGKVFSLMDPGELQPATRHRVRRYRRLLATAVGNVLEVGVRRGVLSPGGVEGEVRRWIELVDALPRLLVGTPASTRQAVAALVFDARCDACLPSARPRPRTTH